MTPDLLAKRYELVKELGRGAMGVVHLAHDRMLDGTDVAIKILPKELETDPRALTRLKREAMTAMKITHSNVMRLINFEESNGARFLVMEYIDGPDLLHVLADAPGGKLDTGTFLRYADGICTGVAYAHRQNVVHSDLKPSNIMFNANGDVKITDFGVAQVVRETMTRVSRVETAGTLLYMSPELLNGEHNTPLSDQYALGITFYEMLTSDPPFVRGDITKQHETKPVPPIPDVPEHINDAILRALAKKPEDRFQSVEEFGKALRGEIEIPTETDWREAKTETWSERETITVEPVSMKLTGATTRSINSLTGHSKWVRFVAVVACAVVVIAWRLNHSADVADLQKQIESALESYEFDRATTLTANLYELDTDAAASFPERIDSAQHARQQRINEFTNTLRSTWRAGKTARRNDVLTQLRELDPDNAAVTKFLYMPGECIRTLTGHFSNVLSVAVAGDRIVSGSSDQTIKIWRAPWE